MGPSSKVDFREVSASAQLCLFEVILLTSKLKVGGKGSSHKSIQPPSKLDI